MSIRLTGILVIYGRNLYKYLIPFSSIPAPMIIIVSGAIIRHNTGHQRLEVRDLLYLRASMIFLLSKIIAYITKASQIVNTIPGMMNNKNPVITISPTKSDAKKTGGTNLSDCFNSIIIEICELLFKIVEILFVMEIASIMLNKETIKFMMITPAIDSGVI